MKLSDYLTAHKIGPTAFAALIGVNHATVVRYRDGVRVPRAENMARIIAATDGAVQPNDFYQEIGHD